MKKGNDARALVNAVLSTSKPFVIPKDPEHVRQILFDLANHARSLDRQLSLTRETFGGYDASSVPTITAVPSLSDTPEAKEDGDVEDSIEQLTAELRKWQQTLRIRAPPFVFPEDDLFYDLIDLYFTRHHPFFPLLHRPTFESLVAEGLHLRDRSFGATVLAVCAIASRQFNDPRAFCEGTTSEHSLGWKYFRQIPLIRDSFTEPPTLYDIQLCSLAVYFLQTAPTPEAAWTIVGAGIRSAQEMGLHRKDASSELKTVEDELWRRAFWTLVCMDVFLSTSLGRPRATTPDE
ncbi:Gypsy retrotransposon integrase-like protein 1 [Marasmius tenuissimus]|uniref:Gypsy retrotransposon integrase-like protein 1 n=1 Tax=Marasmius tenuissimus TaxID=585030 RepID=A0ABR3A8L0_9AGAR